MGAMVAVAAQANPQAVTAAAVLKGDQRLRVAGAAAALRVHMPS